MTDRPLSLRARLLRLTARLLIRPVLHSARPPAWRRQRLARLTRLTAMPPRGARFETSALAGVPVEWSRCAAAAPYRLLYLHGGAYVQGAPAVYRDLTARLAQACAAEVCAPDYRLAPEHPFPAALDDALAVYRALLDQGVAAGQIAIIGDSAGGGLTLATALAIRDAGLPLPAALVCYSPWVDLRLDAPSVQARAGAEVLLGADMLRAAAAQYLDGRDPLTPLASPLFAELPGLPPLLIQVGTDEILYDDAQRLFERASAAGVHAELQIGPRLWHVWQAFAGKMPEADRAVADTAAFLRAHWRA